MFERRHSHVVIVEDDMLFSPGGWACSGCSGWSDACGRCCLQEMPWAVPCHAASCLHPQPAACTAAPADFLLYFEATAPLLDSDPTLWCGHTALAAAQPQLQTANCHFDVPCLICCTTQRCLKPSPCPLPPAPARCVSSWNDNGFVTGHEWDVRRLFRTSYFPGEGRQLQLVCVCALHIEGARQCMLNLFNFCLGQ